MTTETTHAQHQGEISNFGFWVYLMSDCMLFASFFATYAVLGHATASGPSPEQIFDLPFVLLETIILLISSFASGLALLAMHHKKVTLMLASMAATALLGISFIALEISEFVHLISVGQDWQVSAFLSAFFTLVGTHGLHVTFGLIWLSVLIVYLLTKGITAKFDRQLESFVLFWHFLDVIWIFIFSFVYLIPLVI